MQVFRVERDQKKVELIDLESAHPESHCETAREKKCDFFEMNKKEAGQIYAKQRVETSKPAEADAKSDTLTESEEESDDSNNYDTRK